MDGVCVPTPECTCLNRQQELSPGEAHRLHEIREGGGETHQDSKFLAPAPSGSPTPTLLPLPHPSQRTTDRARSRTRGHLGEGPGSCVFCLFFFQEGM
jgi:hypothetical protein